MSLLLYTLAVQFVLRKSAQQCVNNIELQHEIVESRVEGADGHAGDVHQDD